MARGDHIYVRRPLGYTHHGIDCGDGTVIHFTGEPGQAKMHASIARSTWAAFAQDGTCRVREYGARDDAETIIQRAESKVGDTGYGLVENNCEHFATWCCTGRPVSEQVRGMVSLTAQGVVAGTTVAAGGSVIAVLGTVGGLSGPGIMTGLATAGGAVGVGAAAGPAVIGALPAIVSVGITRAALRDDDTLPEGERAARHHGRIAAPVGAVLATGGGLAAISSLGVSGLSAVGISSGLAAIGTVAGGGMVAGAVAVVAAPAVAAAALGGGVYFLSRRLHRAKAPGSDT